VYFNAAAYIGVRELDFRFDLSLFFSFFIFFLFPHFLVVGSMRLIKA